MRKKVEAVLEDIQKEIRQGHLAEVRPRILELGQRRRFPRHLIVKLANLARQSFMHEEAVRLLLPRVRPARGRSNQATEEEQGEYGLALASLGAGAEAVEVLSQLDIERVPWISSGMTLAYFRQWDWEGAIPRLEQYLEDPKRSADARAEAEFDLGIALMHGKDDFTQSRVILEKARRAAEARGNEVLHIETLCQLAQNRFYDRDWKGALEFVAKLERARKQGLELTLGLRIDLLAAEAQLMGSPKSASALAELHAVRRKLERAKIWHRLREADYGEFLCTGDRDILWRLYFGTYFPKAREKFLRIAGLTTADVPEYFDWRVPASEDALPPGRGSRPSSFHLFTGENEVSPKARFKEGQVIQRTLQAVTMDLYAPASSMALFERIYPGESFTPTTSMLKVRQSLWQLRQWFSDNKLPFEVIEQTGYYWLRTLEPMALRIPSTLGLPGGDRPISELDHTTSVAGVLRVQSLSMRARDRFAAEWFSAPDFAEAMELSERSAQRYLKLGVEQGRFESLGGGAGRRYRVAA